MRPFIIGIGGAHSGSGKTTLAVALLKYLAKSRRRKTENREQTTKKKESGFWHLSSVFCGRWGALKYTKTAFYSSITDDKTILCQENKDTKRLLDSGAEEVLWVQAPVTELKEVLPIAISKLSHLDGIIVEGNSAIEFLKPDIVVFIFGRCARRIKGSAQDILRMADVVVFQKEPSLQVPEGARRFKVNLSGSMSGLDECLNYIAGDIEMEEKIIEGLKKKAADELNIKIKNCNPGCF